MGIKFNTLKRYSFGDDSIPLQAGNLITITGNQIDLGGTANKNTILDLSGYDFSIVDGLNPLLKLDNGFFRVNTNIDYIFNGIKAHFNTNGATFRDDNNNTTGYIITGRGGSNTMSIGGGTNTLIDCEIGFNGNTIAYGIYFNYSQNKHFFWGNSDVLAPELVSYDANQDTLLGNGGGIQFHGAYNDYNNNPQGIWSKIKGLKHNGTNDDYKGDIEIFINPGTTPTAIESAFGINYLKNISLGCGLGVADFQDAEGAVFLNDSANDITTNPAGGIIFQSSSGRARIMEVDGALNYAVLAASANKVLGAVANDGYIVLRIAGQDIKFMTTA